MIRQTMWAAALAALLSALAVGAAAQEAAPAPDENEAAVVSETPPLEHAPEPDVTVRGARELPLRYDGAGQTQEMQARKRARARCALRAQGAADPTRAQFDTPEDLCRDDRY